MSSTALAVIPAGPERLEPEPDAPPPPITDDQAERVLRALAEGAPTLRKACAGEGMPRPWQVLALAHCDDEFARKLQLATEMGTDALHDTMVDVEDRVLRGRVHPVAANVALGNMRWRLQRLNRRRWGEKVEVEAKVDATLTVNINRFSEGEK